MNPDTAPPAWEGLPLPHQPPKSLWHSHLHYYQVPRDTGVTALPRPAFPAVLFPEGEQLDHITRAAFPATSRPGRHWEPKLHEPPGASGAVRLADTGWGCETGHRHSWHGRGAPRPLPDVLGSLLAGARLAGSQLPPLTAPGTRWLQSGLHLSWKLSEHLAAPGESWRLHLPKLCHVLSTGMGRESGSSCLAKCR